MIARTSTKSRRSSRRLSLGEPPKAVQWIGQVGGYLSLTEQTLLPARLRRMRITDARALWDAIVRLDVRGAPAIGVAAAYGVVLGVRDSKARSPRALSTGLQRTVDYLASSRPTAVNLFWALDRMAAHGRRLLEGESTVWNPRHQPATNVRRFAAHLLDEAKAIHDEDEKLCEAIGKNGVKLLRHGWSVLTHCNAGALATGGSGTALAVVYAAAKAGKTVRVFADETRPLLQGARLTAWELQQAGVEVTVLCDNAAASLMRSGAIDCVITGADRIAANGDVANKIGTYGVAILAREHGIPFYVAAPSTTFDLTLRSGELIPIEQRSREEVAAGFGQRTVPRGVGVYNPAFDVTPAKFISGLITEVGIIRPPFRRGIAANIAPQLADV